MVAMERGREGRAGVDLGYRETGARRFDERECRKWRGGRRDCVRCLTVTGWLHWRWADE